MIWPYLHSASTTPGVFECSCLTLAGCSFHIVAAHVVAAKDVQKPSMCKRQGYVDHTCMCRSISVVEIETKPSTCKRHCGGGLALHSNQPGVSCHGVSQRTYALCLRTYYILRWLMFASKPQLSARLVCDRMASSVKIIEDRSHVESYIPIWWLYVMFAQCT